MFQRRLFCFLKFIVACHSSQLPEQKEGLFLLVVVSFFVFIVVVADSRKFGQN